MNNHARLPQPADYALARYARQLWSITGKTLISVFPYESFIVYAQSGTWVLERHPSQALEADLIRLNRLFETIEMRRGSKVPLYVENDRHRLLTDCEGEKWSLRPLVISRHQPESEVTESMVRMAAVSLADIHVHGIQEAGLVQPQPYNSLTVVTSVLQRFDELALTIYTDQPKWGPVALFHSLVHVEDDETDPEDLATVISKLPDSNFLKRFRQRKTKDARIRWSSPAHRPQLRWIDLRNRLAATIEAIELEEKALGYPRTLVHGDYGPATIMFDRERISEIVGWRSLSGACPIYDLGYAALMFSAPWKAPYRPASLGVIPHFDSQKLDLLVTIYRSMVLNLLSIEGKNTGFGRAVKSRTLLTNYMRLACYRLLNAMLDDERAMPLGAQNRCRGVLHALHVERLLWP